MNKRITVILAALILVLLSIATYHGLLQFKNTQRITPPNNKNAQDASVATDIPRSGTTPTKPVWAKQIDNPVLQNFFRVDDNLFRGAQPSAAGMKELERLGIRTVINLRSLHSDKDEASGTSLRLEHIRLIALDIDPDDMLRFLRMVGRKENGPFYVHCQHGSDRTGTMCAIYRMIMQDWPREESIKEMTQGGFGYHKIWNTTLVPELRKVNLDLIRTGLGLPVKK